MNKELMPIPVCFCLNSEMSHKRENGSSDQIRNNHQTQIQPAIHLQPLANKRVNGSSDQIGNDHQIQIQPVIYVQQFDNEMVNVSSDQIGNNHYTQVQPITQLQPLGNKRVNGSSDQIGDNEQSSDQIQPVIHLHPLDNKRINGSSHQIGNNHQTQVQPVSHLQPLGNKREAIKDSEDSNQGDDGIDISLPGLASDLNQFYRSLILQQQLEMNRFISQQMEKLKYDLVQKQGLQTSYLIEKFKVLMRKYKEKEEEVERTNELNSALEAKCWSLEDHILRYLAEDAFSDTGSNNFDDEEEEQESVSAV